MVRWTGIRLNGRQKRRARNAQLGVGLPDARDRRAEIGIGLLRRRHHLVQLGNRIPATSPPQAMRAFITHRLPAIRRVSP